MTTIYRKTHKHKRTQSLARNNHVKFIKQNKKKKELNQVSRSIAALISVGILIGLKECRFDVC